MRFEHAHGDAYEDAGGGMVVHSARGFPGFPPRLAVELFERARMLTGRAQVGLWDPMCGAGGIIATVALLRPNELTHVLATDIDDAALELAAKNSRLASAEGLRERGRELLERGAGAARQAAVARLLARTGERERPPIAVTKADVTDVASLRALDLTGIDVVLTDLPYGEQTLWTSASSTPAFAAFDALAAVLPAGAVVVLSTTERDQFRPLPAATRAFKHGHRHIRMYRVG